MKNYKVTNLKTEVVEYLNYDEILKRKLINRKMVTIQQLPTFFFFKPYEEYKNI